jgi:dihydropteroate synthase
MSGDGGAGSDGPDLRRLPAERGVVPGVPGGAGRQTPSFDAPPDAGPGTPGPLGSTLIGGRRFAWGTRTHVMGILNVTPDSFSGDGLLGPDAITEPLTRRDAPDPASVHVAAAVELAARMVAEGADLLDIGGESSRPGHTAVDADEETRRVIPVIEALRSAHPDVPLSVDTTKPAVAAAAIDAGAGLVNDVWGVADDTALLTLAAARGIPIVLMHNRAEARYTNLMAEIVSDLERAIERALRAGCRFEDLLIDPGFGFGKTPHHNLVLLRELETLRVLARPILLGTSRKSTLGRVLDLPPEDRLEATLATTALGIAAGVDIVRVHDVRANVRVARMTDAVIRPGSTEGGPIR